MGGGRPVRRNTASLRRRGQAGKRPAHPVRGRANRMRRPLVRAANKAAYMEAYRQSFNKAYNEGYRVGFARGYEEGHREAYLQL